MRIVQRAFITLQFFNIITFVFCICLLLFKLSHDDSCNTFLYISMAINGIESICSLSRQNFGVYGKCAVAFPALIFEERVAPRSSVLQQYRLRDVPPSCDIIPIYLNLPMPIPTPLATKILLSLGEEEISIPHFSFDNIIPILYFIDYLDYQLFLDVLKRHFLTNHLNSPNLFISFY